MTEAETLVQNLLNSLGSQSLLQGDTAYENLTKLIEEIEHA